MSYDNVYYRIYLNCGDQIAIVCLQRYDEYEYDQTRFLSAQKFESESDAADFINSISNEKKFGLPSIIQKAIESFLQTHVGWRNVLD